MSRRSRTALPAVLIALACLLLPFGTPAVRAAYGLTDTGRHVTTTAPPASDPAVQDAVADTMADTMGDGMVREAGVNRRFAQDAVRSFTTTRVAHDSVPLAGRVPVEHTRVSLLPAADVAALRKGYHVLDVAGFWLPLAAVLFAVSGIAVATRRRRAVTATALGTALGGAFLVLAVAIGRHLTLTDLPDPAHRPAAGAVYDALTSTLRTASWLLLTLGLAVAATTWLTRHIRTPLLLRRRQAPAPPTPPTPAAPAAPEFLKKADA